MPGIDPTSSHITIDQSVEPIHQCPSPATSVSGTACAMSEPTMLAIGSLGYSSNSAVTPSAPAPIDVVVTSTPSSMPTAVVQCVTCRGVSTSIRGAITPTNCRLNTSDSAVSSSNTPSITEINVPAARLFRLNCDSTSSVSTVPGTLPDASSRTMRQFTVRCAPCTSVPTDFVADAYSRSVPTAAAGCTPKSSTSSGVISEPPPVPVCPTSNPTRNPDSMTTRLF